MLRSHIPCGMTDKPETAMLSMDPQPVYLIAGQSAPEQSGLSLMDGLVWAYRRRWWLVIWFVVLMSVQVGALMQNEPFENAFTVRTERGNLEGVMVALQEEIARRGLSTRGVDLHVEFQKQGTAAKADLTKSLILVQVVSPANEETSSLAEILRQVAQAAVARLNSEYLSQASLTVQVASERLQSLRVDSNATVAERSGAEMSLASAKVALQTPPTPQVSEIQRNPAAIGFSKRMALAVVFAGLGSVLLVGAAWGYGEVRRHAARA